MFGYMPRYEDMYYWSFREILDPTKSKEDYLLSSSDILTITSSMTGFSSELINNGQFVNSDVNKLFNLIIKRFHNHVVYKTASGEFSINLRNNFIAKLIYVAEMTSPKYLKLLSLYTSKANQLLEPVKNEVESTNRFNDTPQNSGEYEDDPFTTTFTRINSLTSSDADTIMGRLREIQSSYDNLLLTWSNEFRSLFLEEENI